MGGYVDDEIDLYDDENLETEVPDFHEYNLRLTESSTPREFVIGRFQSEAPDLTDSQTVRVFRDGEGTVTTRQEKRKNAEREDEMNQKSILKDFSGKRVIRSAKSKKPTYRKKMFPRHLRDWNVELSNQKVEMENTVVETRVFTGAFERTGEEGSKMRYSFLLLNDDDTVDLIPVGDHALYRFRARKHRTMTLEQVETRHRTVVDKQGKKLEALETKLQESQAKAELMIGSRPEEIEEKKVSMVKKREDNLLLEEEQKPAKRRATAAVKKEEPDFEPNFDDDDVNPDMSDAEPQEEAAEPAPRGRGARGDTSQQGSDSEGDDNKLSSSGLEMQALLDRENRSEQSDGARSPNRPSSPTNMNS